jgi:hypothetical protein
LVPNSFCRANKNKVALWPGGTGGGGGGHDSSVLMGHNSGALFNYTTAREIL